MISKTYHKYIWLLNTLLTSSPLTFEDGNGGELKEKKGRWGIVPPKHGLKWRMPK